MYRLVSVFVFGALLLVGAGCAGDQKTTTQPAATSQPTASNLASDDHEGVPHLTRLAGTRIDLENRNGFKLGKNEIRFKLYGLDGHEFGPDDLKIQHEKKMHLILVRDDMTGFQHLHPEYADKKWSVETTISEQGQYQMYVDVAPEEEYPVVLRVPVTIGGATLEKKELKPSVDVSAEANNYRATLAFDKTPLKTQEHTKLTYALTKNGQPVKNIDPYLGAFGHVVLIRHNDPDDFFHVHPITEIQPTDGKVTFEAQFPVRGRYTLYAQFNADGQVRTFPITVDVGESGTDIDTSHGHEGDRKAHR